MGDSVTRLAASIGDSFIPALISASQVVGNIADGLRRTNLKAYAAGFAAVTGAIALYNQAILIAKIRTIAFQATLAKTLWGAAAVGAGLVVGKLIELSGAMGEVNEATEEMEKRYERLRNLSGEEIIKLGGSEFDKRMLATKEQLRDVFTASEQVMNSLAENVVAHGMESAKVQDMITVMIKNGNIVRKDAGKAEAVLFAEFHNKQNKKLAGMQLEEEHIAKLIEEYPKLAEALGLLPQPVSPAFTEFHNKQKEKLDSMQLEEEHIAKLIEEYPKLAQALGLLPQLVLPAFTEFLNKQHEKLDSMQLEEEHIARLIEEYPILAEKLGLIAEKTQNSFRLTVNYANMLGEAITNAFEPGQTGGESLKAFIISFINLIQQAVLASKLLSETLTFTFTGPLGVFKAVAALVALEGAKAAVRNVEFAETGFDGVVNQPTLFMTGEGNKAERVSVTPLQGPNINGPQGGGGIHLHFGAVTNEDYVKDFIVPEIQKAQRLNLA